MAKTDGSDLATTEKPKMVSMEQAMEKMRPQIERTLPQHLKVDRFIRVALTALRTNPKLGACNPPSFFGAMMTAAQLGLEINTPLGEAHVIPYKTEATFQIGYQGILSLAYRTGEYAMVYAMEVYKNDAFSYEYGLEPKLIHKPAREPEGDPVIYYAVYHLANGGKAFRVWTREKVIGHAQKFSASYKKGGDSPWKTDFDSMAKKTVLKDLFKYAPKSVTFARALNADETIRTEISEDVDMDLTPTAAMEDDGKVIDAEATEIENGSPEPSDEDLERGAKATKEAMRQEGISFDK